MTARRDHDDVPPPPRSCAATGFLARRVAQPLAAFLHVEAAGGILLVVAAVAALVWANVWPAQLPHVLGHGDRASPSATSRSSSRSRRGSPTG